MINTLKPGLLLLLVLLSGSTPVQQKNDCQYKGIKLYGKVKIVESLPDLKVQVAGAFPDLKVQLVEHFPDECGEWQIVESLADIKVQFVSAFPDLKIQFVNAFPGRTNTKLD
jgi:hypothetical protein